MIIVCRLVGLNRVNRMLRNDFEDDNAQHLGRFDWDAALNTVPGGMGATLPEETWQYTP